jgi:hypothetical protein
MVMTLQNIDLPGTTDARLMDVPSAPPTRGRWVTPVFAVAAGVVMALVFLMVKDSITDDGYITLAYAKNLALHFHWGLIPQVASNTATSPLNIALLGGLTAATRISGSAHPVVALGLLSIGLVMVQAWTWSRLARALRLPIVTALLGVALVVFDPFVLSAMGLEVLLVPTVLIVAVTMAVEGRPMWFGAVAGLALMTRLDLIVFIVPIALSATAVRRHLHWAALTAIVVGGPWYVFSWLVFGSAIPDTLLIKTTQAGLFGVWSYLTGPVMYFIGQHLVVALAFFPALAGVLGLAGWLALRTSVRWPKPGPMPALGPVAALGFGGAAYYLVYALLGVGPYHWYYVPPITALADFVVVAAGVWLAVTRERDATLRPAVPGLALCLVGLLAIGNAGVDLRQGVPWQSPVIFGNWASASDYARVGTGLKAAIGNATVGSPGEIGTLAYFCDCAIIDEFSDRGTDIALINDRIARAGTVTRVLFKVNYLWLNHDLKPTRLDYRLDYAPGPGSGPDVWQVYSAAKGVGHFTLVKLTNGT